MQQSRRRKKIEFSKIVVLFCFLLAVLIITSITILYIKYSLSESIVIAAITGGSSMISLPLIFYFRKAQAENIIKIRMSFVDHVSSVQTRTFKDMLDLKHDYEITEDDISILKEYTSLDEMLLDSVTSTDSKIDDLQSDAEQKIELSS